MSQQGRFLEGGGYKTEEVEIRLDLDTFAHDIESAEDDIDKLLQDMKKLANQVALTFSAVEKELQNILSCVKQMSYWLGECVEEAKMLSNSIAGLTGMMASPEEYTDTNMTDWLAGMANVSTILSGIASLIITLVTNGEAVGVVISAVGTALKTVFTSVAGWIGVAVAAAAAVVTLVTVYWDEISAFLSSVWNAIVSAAGSAVTWISENVIAPIGQLISTLLTNIGMWITGAWNTVMETLSGVAAWFYEKVIQPIAAFLQPAAEWFSKLFQSIGQLLREVCDNTASFIQSTIQIIYAVLMTAAAWIDMNIIQPVASFFRNLCNSIKTWVIETWNAITAVFMGVAAWFDQNVIQPVARFFSDLWKGVCSFAADAWNGIVSVFCKAADWFDHSVVQPIMRIISGITEGFRNVANGVIGFINGMISGIIAGINSVIRALNRLQFTVPDWVPDLGGATVGFHLKTLTTPQIPYLAQGAVLPANRPFMAVVGDQHHGTNIEAPLTTIQEAVGLVMEEHISAMMAGFQALLEEQRAMRHTVESIQIGDDVIAQAVERYNRKMGMIFGL